MSDAQAATVTENGAPVVQEKVEEPGFKVFAGNLAYSTTDEGLKTFFAPVASDILSAQVIQRGNRSAGYGFVALATEEAAQKAVEALNKKELDGRAVIIEIAKPSEQKDKEKKEKKAKRRPGRRGSKAVPGEVSEAEANGETPKPESDAAPESGEAAKPKKKKKKSARKAKKAASVEGATDAAPATEGVEATTAEGTAKKPRARKPKAPRPPRPAGEDPSGEPSKTMLFVANLGFSVDDAGLSALFTEAGIAVVSARIVRRRWGQPRKSKGYGFVDVGSEEEQKKAIAALEGKDVGGRTIAVKIAVNTPHDETADEAAASATDGRRQREIESREEGLSKSLFERAKEEEAAGITSGNKALSIMMKMGFKPGQSLGNTDRSAESVGSRSEGSTGSPSSAAALKTADERTSSPLLGAEPAEGQQHVTTAPSKHKIEPLSLHEWAGRKGIGLGKRARSPDAAERLAKMAKMAEDMDHRDFRERARDEYKNRQAEGRLTPAQLTCATLDEQVGKSFNVLWLNPNNQETFPPGLIDALAMHSNLATIREHQGDSIQTRLRKQMQADALQPIDPDALISVPDSVSGQMKSSSVGAEDQFAPELLEEATQFLRLQAQDRLHLVLSYLREKHHYCFWCGVKYDNEEELQSQCPGPEEDDHD
ncbi:hypothetical protein CPB84DRAFT_1669965 [Gymnopilus junonius]|uniref:RRM domain-containing protein n=1 Tax=Gymnopilus junonius TaxID=109634 RepID=A0A9P5TV73_GYMJU|nr:hypothetical protein CPB84DRAFT_1669965 [Gymnopilus junonius]